MQSSTAEIRRLLKNNRMYRIQAANGLGGELSAKLEFLDKAIGALCEDDCKLIKTVFIDKTPIVNVAKAIYCARRTVYRKCDRIIQLIAEVYGEQFKS